MLYIYRICTQYCFVDAQIHFTFKVFFFAFLTLLHCIDWVNSLCRCTLFTIIPYNTINKGHIIYNEKLKYTQYDIYTVISAYLPSTQSYKQILYHVKTTCMDNKKVFGTLMAIKTRLHFKLPFNCLISSLALLSSYLA